MHEQTVLVECSIREFGSVQEYMKECGCKESKLCAGINSLTVDLGVLNAGSGSVRAYAGFVPD